MIKKIAILLIAFFCVLIEVNAASVRIYGKVRNANGLTLRLKTFVDYVTFRDTILKETFLKDSAEFDFQIEVNEPKIIKLKCGFQHTSFYVEPNNKYHLDIHYDPDNEQVSYLADQRLLFEFIDLPKNDLNEKIGKFNGLTDRFLIKHYDRIYKRREYHLIDTLRTQAFQLNTSSDDYFFDVINFRIADLKLAAKSISSYDCYMEYFAFKPIQYKNYEYMVFFYTYFYKYLLEKCKLLPLETLRKLAHKDSINDLLNYLKKDVIFQDARLRELVVLLNLNGMFFNYEFKPTKILAYIKELKKTSTYPEHKIIARNFIKRITALQPGSKMPDFNLHNLNGDEMCLEDYKGKYVLMNFWALDCKDCFQDLDSLNYLQKRYANKMYVVNISGLKKKKELKSFIKDKNYDIQFLIAQPDNKIYENLNIRSLPATILIDDKGNIKLYPAILRKKGYKGTFEMIFK
jgi:peroxiredoxin